MQGLPSDLNGGNTPLNCTPCFRFCDQGLHSKKNEPESPKEESRQELYDLGEVLLVAL